jgi:hypothetical protein
MSNYKINRFTKYFDLYKIRHNNIFANGQRYMKFEVLAETGRLQSSRSWRTFCSPWQILTQISDQSKFVIVQNV